MTKFDSTVLILPGLGNSGKKHWQSLWQKQFPEFTRVNQQEWDAPDKNDWTRALNEEIKRHPADKVILVAHSLACTAVAYWAQ